MFCPLFKNVNVSRGLVYHYYSTPAEAGKPVLLFLHGFPSTSYDWRHQIAFFQDQGYGLIVPDMLGYGGTAKPVDPHFYASSLISRDMVDLLDAENVDEAIVIGHDWGSKIVGRLANYFPERFYAFAFLSLSYFSPAVLESSFVELNNITKQAIGYEIFGYWGFFSADGADQIIENNLDSFFDILFTANRIQTITNFAPLGALQAWLEANSTTETGDFITPAERAIQIDAMRSEGMRAPLCWYEIVTSTIERDDDQGIPQENLTIKKPVFFGAALEDYVCVAAIEITTILQTSENVTTIHQYDSGHWVQLEAKDQVNSDLLTWIEGL
ncbi:alpha/beta-hydrolase [Lentinula aciculospora]|uniref:Alpha/beta-hydrolase n=1 Tax=Lentinula aciculospora TaxID=153920 RepID=A0A9W8ZUS1_9AGAR|nr:alpha/beta-hydrolase [Lentinula aciculospora]